jgi:hypothetical protein
MPSWCRVLGSSSRTEKRKKKKKEEGGQTDLASICENDPRGFG